MTTTPSERRSQREAKADKKIIAHTKTEIDSLAKRRKQFKPSAPALARARPYRTPDSHLTAASLTVERLAAQIHDVRDHVQHELANLGSLPDHTPLASEPEGIPRKPLEGNCKALIPLGEDVWHVCGLYRPCAEHDTPVQLTPVERAAEHRLQLSLDLADYEAQCRLITFTASEAMRAGDRLLSTRLEGDDKPDTKITVKCSDGQVGKAGAFEWGDPTCEADGVKSDMCVREYWRWYRYRKANGQKTPEIVDIDEDGAA